MDGINFQGMSRVPLTATEEALIPRPPSSASQVATVLPSTYTRFGSSHSLASAPSFHSLNRPLNSPNRQSLPHSSPSAPTSPHGEQEYPQNPQDSYYSNSPAVSLRRGSHPLDPTLHQAHQDSWGSRMDSPTPMTESDDSDDEDDGEISRETDSSKERPPKPHSQRHQDHHHHPRRSADLLRRLKQSTNFTFGGVEGEGSHPGSGFPANNTNIHNQYISSHHPHRSHHRTLDLHVQQHAQDSPSGSRRTSREYSDEDRASPLVPLHHAEPRRSRSAWRPSLSLIRQESSIHGQYPSIHGQYPQHDTRPLDNASALNQLPIPEESPRRHRAKQKKAPKKDKKKPTKVKKVDKKPKVRPEEKLDDRSRNVLTMPNLQQVLEKKTSYPLGYDDFEAFLRTKRAAEYLNFWADVTAHEQLCRTFDVSERRQMRELQLEERAIARDKRRVALLQHAEAHHSSDQTDHGDLNNSNLYLTSRSSLQLPLIDHLSFPAENRRYGQDSASAYAPPTRRQTYHPIGTYNKLLAGVERSNHGRRSSMDRTRTSISASPFSSQHHFAPSSSSTPISYNQMMRKRGSTDILAGAKASTGDIRTGDLRQSASQQQISSKSHPNTLDEIAKLTQAVEESIQLSLARNDPGASPLSVLEPALFREPSTTFEQGVGLLQAPLAIRRSVDGPKPTISAPQEPKTLLVQSYRTIGLEDVQESALRIYRKFLIQLRTASMAAEEAAAASSSKRSSAPGLPRGSVDGVAQRWDGYAEQVIAEWNEKWRDCGPEARRLRRLSGRTGVSDRGDGDHHGDIKDEKHQMYESKESRLEQGLSEMVREEGLARRRSGAGFTAFLNRLLRTETTILELPTLTINTTTVEEEVVASDESEDSGDEEEDYDSDIDDDDEEEEGVMGIGRKDVRAPLKGSEIELQAVTIEAAIRLKEAEVIGGSTAADSRRSSISISGSSCDHTSEQELKNEEIKLPRPAAAGPNRQCSLKKPDRARGTRLTTGRVMPVTSKVANPGPLATMMKQGRRTSLSSMDTLNPFGCLKVEPPLFLKAAGGSVVPTRRDKMESGQEPDLQKEQGNSDPRPLQRLSSASLPLPSHPAFPYSNTSSSSPAPRSSEPLPHPSLSAPGDTMGAAAGTTFYLPLECRQRIHAQVLEEGRTEAPYLFGPAKGFVIEIVLRDHYYPLFLQHVQQQNLGLSSPHQVSIIRKRGMLGIGIALCAVVVAAQVTFVLVGLGGWASPWVWVVGLIGGWAGTVCSVTGILGFSPILGLVGQLAEDRHVWRFRKIVDPSIRTLHFRRSMWMLTFCAFWSSVVTVIFAALPARE